MSVRHTVVNGTGKRLSHDKKKNFGRRQVPPKRGQLICHTVRRHIP